MLSQDYLVVIIASAKYQNNVVFAIGPVADVVQNVAQNVTNMIVVTQ